jgi:hypothetical protein
VDSVQSVETIVFSPEQVQKETFVGLRFVKYQNVHSLCIFIQDNQDDDDVTVLERLILFGQPIEATKNISELTKNDEA